MIWVRITSVLFCLVGLAFVLAPSAGELRTATDVDKKTSTVGQPESVIVDSIYRDDPFVKRVRDTSSDGSFRQTVPMVELDTVVHEKKLWLSEKKIISAPFKSKRPKIAAQDSIVYVVYSMEDSTNTLQSTWSLDYGSNFSESQLIQRTRYSGTPDLQMIGDLICMTYVATSRDNNQHEEVLYRKTMVGDFIMGDSIIIKTTDWHNDSAMVYCQVLEFNGSLRASYWFYHYYYGRTDKVSDLH